MSSIGIRDLKNNLSHVVRRVVAGESIDVTDHGHVVARLTPPIIDRSGADTFNRLVATGVIKAAIDVATPVIDWPAMRRTRARRGLMADLISADRGD